MHWEMCLLDSAGWALLVHFIVLSWEFDRWIEELPVFACMRTNLH
jgi:hypothetical protein